MRLTKKQKQAAMCAYAPRRNERGLIYAALVTRSPDGFWRDNQCVVYNGPLYTTSRDAIRAARRKHV